MRKKTIVSFALVTLFFVSFLTMNTLCGTIESHGNFGSTGMQPTIDWWPMFRHYVNHTGYSTSTAPNTNQILWKHPTSGYVDSSPAVVDGMVFVGSGDCNVYCLDASTGAYLWNYTTSDRVFSSPAVVDGRVYVGSYDKSVYALNASTGAYLWNYTTGSYVDSSPAVAYGMVFVGSYDKNVYALDASTGTLVWSKTTGGAVKSSPAVADGKIYVGSENHNVYCLDASTGAYLWNYTTGSYVDSSPAVADGMVYVGSEDNKVYAYGPPPYEVTIKARCITEGADVNVQIAKDGSPTGYTTPHTFPNLAGTHTFTVQDTDASGHPFKQWNAAETDITITVTSSGTHTAYYQEMWPMFHHDPNHTGYSTSTAPNTNQTLWNYTTGGAVGSSPAVADGKVYVGSWDGNVYALDASTGALVWNYTTGGAVKSSPAVAYGRVYVGSRDKSVYALNASTGAYLWNYTTGSYVDSSPAVAGGKVFVGSDDNSTYCLDASSGALVWSYTTGWLVDSSPAVADGKVYVGSWDGNVYALNASTGAYLWNYTTGGVVDSSPAVVGGKVFVGSDDQYVYALNASTGVLVWSYLAGGAVVSSPAVAYGMVFVGSFDEKVYGLNATTGICIWSYETGFFVGSSPAVADGKVYVGSWDGNVYALNACTGALVWSYTLGTLESSPAVAGGMVFGCSGNGKVYAFGVHDVAITNFTPSKTVVFQGFSMNMTVAVANHGYYTENFTVTVYANSSGLTGYKKPITITGRNGSTLTDYQVLLTIDTASLISAGKLRPDCGDIRFKDSGGSAIPYWIESGINSNNTKIWVKVPNIPSSGNTTIYMYYGNPALNSLSNGTTTFYFFDDFNNFDKTKWVLDTSSGKANASVSNGELVLNASGGTPSGDSVWVILKSPCPGSYIIGTKARRLSPLGESSTGILWRVNETGPWLNSEHWVYQCYYNGSNAAYLSMSNDTGFGGPSLTGVPIGGPGVTGYVKRDYLGKNYYSVIDGTQQAGSLNESTDGNWTSVQDTNRVGISAENYDTDPSFDFRYDWFFVANYVYPEPAVYVGEEQLAQAIASQTVTLSSGNSANITLIWNSAGFARGNYTMWAYAWPVLGETYTVDNNFTANCIVVVSGVGDLTGKTPNPFDFVPDGRVYIEDVAVVSKFFGYKVPPTPANCDVTGPTIGVPDGKIQIDDVATVSKHFGQLYP